ncbi:MAG TPA: dihydrodipicolinate synthase family protein [Symbiobacteriaceae bacterium]|nr:dihydrodipicolinate synthase family protein [Symbiobacteriaceae bacterium]
MEVQNDVLRLEGVFAPVPTVFDEQGNLALDRLQANIVRLCEAGIDGVVLLGSNGEYVSLSEAEKLAVIKAGLAALPAGKLGLVGTGCESTRGTVELTAEAARLGAHAVMVVHPSYYKPLLNKAALLNHYRTVAKAAPVPVLLYSVPKFTGFDLPVDVAVALSQEENIIGIKDSAGNVIQLQELLLKARPGWNVLVGTGSALLAALSVGVTGGVLALANVAPAECAGLYRLCREGRWAEARTLQARLLPVNQAVGGYMGIPGVKAAMEMLGYHGGPPRLPLQPLSAEERRVLSGILTSSQLLP